MGINNTTVKLVNKSLVNDVGNLFTKGKNGRANAAGLGFISYSIDTQVVINMTIEMLKHKKWSRAQNISKDSLSKLIRTDLTIKFQTKNGENKILSPL